MITPASSDQGVAKVKQVGGARGYTPVQPGGHTS